MYVTVKSLATENWPKDLHMIVQAPQHANNQLQAVKRSNKWLDKHQQLNNLSSTASSYETHDFIAQSQHRGKNSLTSVHNVLAPYHPSACEIK